MMVPGNLFPGYLKMTANFFLCAPLCNFVAKIKRWILGY
jgi:hypothetical protein